MKVGWQKTRLGNVISENPKSKLKVRESKTDGEFPFFTSGVKTSSFDNFLCDGKNLFIATGGKACLQYYEGKASYSTDCYSLTTRSDVSPKFLFYYLDSILALIDEQMFEGAALRHLQKTKFRDIVMPLPPLPEQQRIVGILDEALDGIATARATAEQNFNNSRAIYASTLNFLFANTEGNNKTVELGELIETLTDYHANGSYEVLKRNVELKDTEDYAWMVRSTDFENNFKNDMRYISKASYNFLAKSRIFGGEIIMSKIGNAGKVYLMPETTRPCSLAMNLFLIRVDENRVSHEFVYHYLKSERGENQIRSKLNGAATQTITKESVRGLQLPVFPRDMQNRIVSKLECMLAETQRLESLYQRKLAALDELKKSLLHQAFSGAL